MARLDRHHPAHRGGGHLKMALLVRGLHAPLPACMLLAGAYPRDRESWLQGCYCSIPGSQRYMPRLCMPRAIRVPLAVVHGQQCTGSSCGQASSDLLPTEPALQGLVVLAAVLGMLNVAPSSIHMELQSSASKQELRRQTGGWVLHVGAARAAAGREI